MRVLIVRHWDPSTSRIDDALDAIGAEVVTLRFDLGDPVPSEGSYDRVVILGGPMGAYETGLHPWLAGEKRWIRALVERGTPVLGICLGAQMLADALGGQAYLSEVPEAGVVALALTAAGTADPVMAVAGTRVFSLHQDTFSLPPGATLLATSERLPHAVRMGSALALQFHPDADLELALEWGRHEAPILRRAGVTFEDYARGLAEADDYLDERSRKLFQAWLEHP